MTTTQSVDGPETVGTTARSNRWRGAAWIAGIVGGLALAVAVALSILANRPVIAVAAACGLLVVVLVAMLLRARRRRRWIIIGTAAALLALAGAFAIFFLTTREGVNSGAVTPLQTVEYHGEARVVGDELAIRELVVLDAQLMAAIAKATASSEEPDVQLTGWHDNGVVNGYPAFARNRTLPWDHTNILADTARVDLDIGSLAAQAGEGTYNAELAVATGSRLVVVLAKGAIGSTSPAAATRTDALSGLPEETITFAVDRYDSAVSFDVLRPPLRNPAGHAVYDASLWGFWQWAAGTVGAVVSGLVIDKLGEALWRPVAALFRRRRPTPLST